MPTYHVRVEGPFGNRRTVVIDATDAEQAWRRGKDGGNRVVWVRESDSETDEQGTLWQTVAPNDDE